MWSKDLQQTTKEFLEKYKMAPMKNSKEVGCGFCIVREGKYYITEREGDGKYEYNSIEALLEDGWAVD